MPNPKTQELLESVTASIKKLAETTDATARSEGFRAWLRTTSRFYNYSFGNQMLIAFQRPNAERVAGFHTWKSLGRHVKKGAKGIAILAPVVRKIKGDAAETEDQSKVVGFRAAYVFDAADTEGEPLAELGSYRANAGGEALLSKLEAAAKELGITVRYEAVGDGAKGFSAGGLVVVEQALSPTERAGTLAHELAHEVLHQGAQRKEAREKTRAQRELEAEATSFAVLAHFGIEQASDLYLASWDATAETLTESLETIRNAVHIILNAIEDAAKHEQAANDDTQSPDLAMAA